MQDFRMNKFIRLCLDLANVIDSENICDSKYFEEFGVGKRNISNYLRLGAKLCIDMQIAYVQKINDADFAKAQEKETRNFLKECFGVEDIYDISEDDKKIILELMKKRKERE